MDEYLRPIFAAGGTLKMVLLTGLAGMSLIADIAAGPEGTLLGQGLIATVLGFLGWFVKSWLADMRAEVKSARESQVAESKALRLEVAENTRVTTIALLEIAALIPGARGMLETAKQGAIDRIAHTSKVDPQS